MNAIATLILTAVLVAITAWYAKRTSDMVNEMKQSREAEAEPKLVLDLQGVGPTTVFPALVNVGAGPGLSVIATLSFLDSEGSLVECRRWRTPVLMPGDRRRFFPPDDANGQLPNIDSLSQRVARIQLAGLVMDRLGRTHHLDYTIEDLGEWRDLLTIAKEEYLVPTDEKVASELKKLRERLEKLTRVLTRGLHIRTDDDLEQEALERRKQLEELSSEVQASEPSSEVS